jgi:hypothetical protein
VASAGALVVLATGLVPQDPNVLKSWMFRVPIHIGSHRVDPFVCLGTAVTICR